MKNRMGEVPETGYSRTGGQYPGYGAYNSGEMPDLPPNPRAHRPWKIFGIIMACVLGIAVVCGGGIAVLGATLGGPDPISITPANTTNASVTQSPTIDPRSSGAFGQKLGTTVTVAVDSEADGSPESAVATSVTKIVRTPYCDKYDKPGPGRQDLVILLTSTATKGRPDVSSIDFAFTDSAGSAVDSTYDDCSKVAGVKMGGYPTDNGMKTGLKVVGFLVFNVPTGTTGTLTWSPDFIDEASWVIPK